MTDPHAPDPIHPSSSTDGAGGRPLPKAPPPPLTGRAPRPTAVRIRRPVVQAGVLGAALLLSGSLAWAFIVQPELRTRARDAAQDERLDPNRGGVRPSDRVTGQPAAYDRLTDANGLPEPRLGPGSEADAETALAPTGEAPPANAAPPGRTAAGPSARAQAAASDLFFGSARDGPARADPATAEAAPDHGRQDLGLLYSPHGLVAPVSPFELKAGTLVPGVLLTSIDTARPGPVLATVSQNVFDSVAGRHLLIPQGSRLIGRHEGEAAHGQERAFLVWDRLILPNGKSLVLGEAPGVDAQGAVGLPGQTRRRLLPLAVASVFAGAISTLGELARGGAGDAPRSLLGSAGDAASIEAAQVGGRLIDRELQVRPSIRVVAGAPVRVLITRDLILEPYVR